MNRAHHLLLSLILLLPQVHAQITIPITNWTRDDLLEAKKQWRQQGFKLDSSQFDLSNASPAQISAVALVTNAGFMLRLRGPLLMQPTSPAESLVVLSDQTLHDPQGTDWISLEQEFHAHEPLLAQARSAVLQTPLRVNLVPRKGDILLPHLSAFKQTTLNFTLAALTDVLHHREDHAFTNLLAAVVLTAHWEIEPLEISHLVRAAMLRLLSTSLWEALAFHPFSDQQLAALQEPLLQLDLLTSLPEALALQRPLLIANIEAARDDTRAKLSIAQDIKKAASQPTQAFSILKNSLDSRDHLRDWINRWSVLEEALLLHHYIEEEKALRAALQKTAWLEMTPLWLPAATNELPSHPEFRVATRVRLQRTSAKMAMMYRSRGLNHFIPPGAGTMLGRLIQAEAERRILLTALAIERHRLAHNSPPLTLTALLPDFLPSLPLDPIDGQPLRYSLDPDGRFLIYSIDLDAQDNSGAQLYHHLPETERGKPHDITWPKPVFHPSHSPSAAPPQ